jgi:hypothetical protein
MTRSEYRQQHQREAARLQSLLANATTAQMRARLLEEFNKHEHLAREGDRPRGGEVIE